MLYDNIDFSWESFFGGEIQKEYFLKLPQELLIKLDWSEGDELKFEVQDDSTITISKEDKE